MSYIKCVGIFLLVHLFVVAIKWLNKIQDEPVTDIEKIGLTLIGYLAGGLWIFLLLKLI